MRQNEAALHTYTRFCHTLFPLFLPPLHPSSVHHLIAFCQQGRFCVPTLTPQHTMKLSAKWPDVKSLYAGPAVAEKPELTINHQYYINKWYRCDSNPVWMTVRDVHSCNEWNQTSVSKSSVGSSMKSLYLIDVPGHQKCNPAKTWSYTKVLPLL